MRRRKLVPLAATLALGLPSVAMADPAENITNWATWTIPTEFPFTSVGGSYQYAGGTTGTAIDPVSGDELNLTISGEVASFSDANFEWYPYPSGNEAYVSTESPNSPVGEGMVAATGDTLEEYKAHTLSFGADAEVTNAVMALWSLGNNEGKPGQLTFSQPFVILSDNGLMSSGGDSETGYTLTGSEGNGVIQFLGTYDTISWVVSGTEIWHGLTVGLTTPDNPEAGNSEIVAYDLFGEGSGVTAPTPFPSATDTDTDTDTDTEVAADPEPEAPRMSVLERVLAQIDGATNLASVNGTFVNIAENLGGSDGAGIDGSISNVVTGVNEITQTAMTGASALEYNLPTLDFGNMATTALGAVNTGDIALGVNSTVDDARTSSTHAVSAVMDQIGGASGTGALVLNVASNMTGVNGSISNTLAMVNGSIGNLSTTALGAVNTGTIVSGINAAVTGITGAGG